MKSQGQVGLRVAEGENGGGRIDPGQTYNWLPAQMPGVARLIAAKRAAHGGAWVNECWRRGVQQHVGGWFFAGEGGLMVGTLWEDSLIVAFACGRITRTQALLVMREPAATTADAAPKVAP